MPQNIYIFSPKNDFVELNKQAITMIGADFGIAAIREVILQNKYNPDDRGLGRSKMLGNLVLSNLDISGDSYTDSNGTLISFPDLRFDAVLFEVRNSKNIVKTGIQGKKGTVKEFISDGDYEISVRGVIAGNNGQYPGKKAGASGDATNTVDALRTAMDANVELSVNSWFLAQFGIYKIVITDRGYPQEEGTYSTQKFWFTADSDEDYVVNLKS